MQLSINCRSFFKLKEKKIKLGGLKPHLHDIHVGSGTPKNGHAGRYFWHSRLIFLPSKCYFLAHSPKKSGRPRPPREVVLASLKSGPRIRVSAIFFFFDFNVCTTSKFPGEHHVMLRDCRKLIGFAESASSYIVLYSRLIWLNGSITLIRQG